MVRRKKGHISTLQATRPVQATCLVPNDVLNELVSLRRSKVDGVGRFELYLGKSVKILTFTDQKEIQMSFSGEY